MASAPPRKGRDRRRRLRDLLWPRMGLRRYLIYLKKRILRLSASPHAIGAGVASGAAVSVFPFVGLHFLLGFGLAFVVRGNMLAAAIGTAWGNPITFPIFFSLSYQLGTMMQRMIWGAPAADVGPMTAASTDALSGGVFAIDLASLLPLLRTMVLGALPLSLFVWVFFYLVVRTVAASFQMARRRRFARRGARRQASE